MTSEGYDHQEITQMPAPMNASTREKVDEQNQLDAHCYRIWAPYSLRTLLANGPAERNFGESSLPRDAPVWTARLPIAVVARYEIHQLPDARTSGVNPPYH